LSGGNGSGAAREGQNEGGTSKRTKPRLPIHDQAIQLVKELFEKEAPETHPMAVVGYMNMDA
jgi:hypothetical protein